MLLDEFVSQFGNLGDEFLAHFPHPFLVEEGRLDDVEEGAATAQRQVFYLHAESDTPLVLGRKASADLCLKDNNVSSRHAQFAPPQEGSDRWTVKDLGSTNGTFVNGAQLEPHRPVELRDESVIGLGPGSLYVFLLPQSFLVLLRRLVKRLGDQEEEGPQRGGGSLASETQVQMRAVALDPPPHDSGVVDTHDGVYLRCEPFDPVPLEPGAKVVVGRSGVHATMVLPHPQVSRRHCEIERHADGAIFVRDLHSANGTFVGQTKVGGEPLEVTPGKTISVGDFRIRVAGPPTEVGGRTVVLPPTQSPKRRIKGSLAKVSLEHLLLGVEEKQKSGMLTVQCSNGFGGRITFRAGKPHTAEASDGSRGVAAIRRLLQLEDGEFSIDVAAKVGPRELEVSFSDVLLDDLLAG